MVSVFEASSNDILDVILSANIESVAVSEMSAGLEIWQLGDMKSMEKSETPPRKISWPIFYILVLFTCLSLQMLISLEMIDLKDI